MKGASGAWARAASSRLRVPLALTPKSICGALAAQSCEGWAAVWITSSIWPACWAKIAMIRSASRMSACSQWKSPGCSLTRRSVTCEVEDSGPKKLARMSFSIPTTSKPSAMKCSTASEPIRPRPASPVMIDFDPLSLAMLPAEQIKDAGRGPCRGQGQDRGRRDAKCAGCVVQVCVDWNPIILGSSRCSKPRLSAPRRRRSTRGCPPAPARRCGAGRHSSRPKIRSQSER